MFKLIAADLREFVSAVKDDTASVVVTIVRQDTMGTLDKLDQVIGLPVPSEAEREAQFRTSVREVYSTALPSTLQQQQQQQQQQQPSADDEAAHNPRTGIDEQVRAFEAHEITEFLNTFNIVDKTNEISRLLQRNEKLRMIFAELVPIEVVYEEFWRRHFYRCDASRIQRAWDAAVALGGGDGNALSRISGVIAAAPVRLLSLQPLLAPRKVIDTAPMPSLKPKEEETRSPEKLRQDAFRDIELMQSALSISNNRIAALRLSVDELQKDLRASSGTNAELTTELVLLQKQLQQKDDCIKNLEDQFLLQLEVSRPDVSSLSSVVAFNKPSGRHRLDDSARTETTESSSSASSTADQHIGTCVAVLPAAVKSSRDPSGKQPTTSALWKLATYGRWGGNDDSLDGDSCTEEDDIADPPIHYLADIY
jgi:BSD domain